MRRIWKFDSRGVAMPKGAKLLTVQMQGDAIMLWAELDEAAPIVVRNLIRYGTGWDVAKDPGTYVGTVQGSGGFVWHLYDQGEQPL